MVQESLEELQERWLAVNVDPSEADSWFDDIAFALSSLEPAGVLFLRQFLCDKDEARRTAALRHLASTQNGDTEVLEALQAAFASPTTSLKTVALWGYIDLQRFPLSRQSIEYLRKQEDERLAALAMVYLSHAYPN